MNSKNCVSENMLPPGWETTSFGSIATYINGRCFKSSEWEDTGKPIIRIQNLNNEKAHFNYTNSDFEEKYRVIKGDLLFSWSASLGVYFWNQDDAWLNQHIFKVLPHGVSKKYLYYCLDHHLVQLSSKTHGQGMVHITKGKFESHEIIIPPLNEQSRIVEQIEELFSDLDKGIESLKTAKELLKVYRQALLKHAFEGKLTEQWRNDNVDKLETADQLLERIQKAHEERCKRQLAEWKKAVKKWEAAGKEGNKPAKFKQTIIKQNLSAAEINLLPDIPDNYAYTYLSELGNLGRGKSKHRPRNAPKLFGGRYPFVQTGEIKAANRVVKTHKQTLSDIGLAQSKLWPKGTLCITIAANIAETAVLGFDGCFPDSIVGFTAFDEIIQSKYIEFFIMSVRERIEAYAPATAQKNINLTTLENLVVPLTSLEEQKSIVNILDEKFSIIDNNIQEIEDSVLHADILRQAILKTAFAGRLVLQDPNDEPASKLLKKIAIEKNKLEKGIKAAKASTKKVTTKTKTNKKSVVKRKAPEKVINI